jgi:hypothetical protein
MKKVYVDASDRKKLIAIVVNGETKATWVSTLSCGRHKIETPEVRVCAQRPSFQPLPNTFMLTHKHFPSSRSLRNKPSTSGSLTLSRLILTVNQYDRQN